MCVRARVCVRAWVGGWGDGNLYSPYSATQEMVLTASLPTFLHNVRISTNEFCGKSTPHDTQ